MTHDSKTTSWTRLIWSMVAGSLLAVPVGWLLATLAMLPAFLGLFFCMLLGLLVGAVMFRISRSVRPIPRPRLWLAGLLVTFVIWGTSLASEYTNARGYDLYRYGSQGWTWYPVAGDVTETVRSVFRHRSFAPEEIARLRTETRRVFCETLAERYPPGGFLGFVRFCLTDDTIELPCVFGDSTESFQPRQHGTVWVIRVCLALVLTAVAVLSQILGLAGDGQNVSLSSSNPDSDTLTKKEPEQSSD